MGTANSFNGFSFDSQTDNSGYIVDRWETEVGRRTPSMSVPRSDIGVDQDVGRSITVHHVGVLVVGASAAGFRSNLHALYDAVDGVVARLYHNSDKYWMARLSNKFTVSHEKDKLQRSALITLEFTSVDPFLYYDSGTVSTTWGPYTNPSTVSDSKSVANSGGAYCGRSYAGGGGPQFTLTGPLKNPIVVTRTAPSTQSFTISEDIAAGHVWVVDTGLRRVLKDGVETYTNFSGDTSTFGFPWLESGSNTFSLACANGNNTGNMVLGFIPRDRGID